MTRNRWPCNSVSKRGEYAGEDDFAYTFEREQARLQRLALLLTANAEAARSCVRLAFDECIASSSVFKEWALKWARRMIIRNAASLTLNPDKPLGSRNGGSGTAIAHIPDYPLESILDLPALERLAYVICVLERYSTNDCALLLGRSPREIDRALDRVGSHRGEIEESRQMCTANRTCLERLSKAEEEDEYSFLQSN